MGEPRSRRGEQTPPAARKGSSARSVISSLHSRLLNPFKKISQSSHPLQWFWIPSTLITPRKRRERYACASKKLIKLHVTFKSLPFLAFRVQKYNGKKVPSQQRSICNHFQWRWKKISAGGRLRTSLRTWQLPSAFQFAGHCHRLFQEKHCWHKASFTTAAPKHLLPHRDWLPRCLPPGFQTRSKSVSNLTSPCQLCFYWFLGTGLHEEIL